MDEWMDEAFGRAWINYANISLLDMGLIPKTRVRVEKIAPLGDPMELRVRGYALSLRKEDAREIQVEEAKA